MATIKAVIIRHHQKEDGTYNVKIRVTHNRKAAYIATPYFVTKAQLSRNMDIKDNIVQTYVDTYVNLLRVNLMQLGDRCEAYTAKELANYLLAKSKQKAGGKKVDFIDYMSRYIAELRKAGKNSADNYSPALNKMKAYAGETLSFEDITPSFLENLEKYIYSTGTGQRGVSLYMTCYRKIFNHARERLNDEDKDIVEIRNYPFKKYKVPAIPESGIKAAGAVVVKQVYNYEPTGVIDALAKDMFLLSFYLVGINAADLYLLPADCIRGGRLEYARAKTKDRRRDGAKISIRIEPEAEKLIEKYRDTSGAWLLNIHQRYHNTKNLNVVLSKGMRTIGASLNLDNLTYYSARHSWATVASYDCDISEDRIARCLNHVSAHRVTSGYIKKDWSVIDEANRRVIDVVANGH